jgi:hypothetical protein
MQEHGIAIEGVGKTTLPHVIAGRLAGDLGEWT